MTDALSSLLALVAGTGLGAFYFGGLWWAVRHLPSFRRPASSMLASLLVRMGVALGGFYLVADHSWQRLLLCLLGFLAGRGIVGWQLRTVMRRAAAEVLHAP